MIKRHKGLAIIGGLSLILLIIIFAIFSRMLFSSSQTTYGDRLKGLVKIDSSETAKLISEMKKLAEVDDIEVRVQGKIIYITMTFKDQVSEKKAIEIANKTYSYYDEKVLKDYDFGYFLIQKNTDSSSSKDSTFKIAGTKHVDHDYISWTKE